MNESDEAVDPPNRPARRGLDLGVGAYIWMATCGVVGIGCFLYGIQEADDLVFFTAFGVWGAILIPVVFRVSYRAVEVAFSSPLVIAILAFLIIGAGVLLLFRNMSSELLYSLLENEHFVKVLLAALMISGVLGALGIIAFAATKHSGRHYTHLKDKLDVTADLDHEDMHSELELEQMRLKQQIELKKLELEQQQLVIAEKQLELEKIKERLLIAAESRTPDMPGSGQVPPGFGPSGAAPADKQGGEA